MRVSASAAVQAALRVSFAGQERLHLRLQALRGDGELVLLGLQRGLLALQVAHLRRDGHPAGQRLAGQVLAPGGERLLCLVLQLAGRLLQLQGAEARRVCGFVATSASPRRTCCSSSSCRS